MSPDKAGRGAPVAGVAGGGGAEKSRAEIKGFSMGLQEIDETGSWSIYDLAADCWRWGLTLADAVEIERRNDAYLCSLNSKTTATALIFTDMEQLDDLGYLDDSE